MRRALVFTAAALAGLAALGAVAWTWLTAREPVPDASDYALDLAALRELARESAGPLPVSLHSALVAEASLPARRSSPARASSRTRWSTRSSRSRTRTASPSSIPASHPTTWRRRWAAEPSTRPPGSPCAMPSAGRARW